MVTPRAVARQSPLSMGFSRQGYWSGLPFPPPGDLPEPGIKPRSPASQAGSFPSEPPGEPTSGLGESRTPQAQTWEKEKQRPMSPPTSLQRPLGDLAAVDAQPGAVVGGHLDLVVGPDDEVLEQQVVDIGIRDVLILVPDRQPGQAVPEGRKPGCQG